MQNLTTFDPYKLLKERAALIDMKAIFNDVGKMLEVHYTDILKRGRKREVSEARNIGIKIIIDILNEHLEYERVFGATSISNFLGFGNHTDIIHSYKKANLLLEGDKPFIAKWQMCQHLVGKYRTELAHEIHKQKIAKDKANSEVTKRDELHIDC